MEANYGKLFYEMTNICKKHWLTLDKKYYYSGWQCEIMRRNENYEYIN